MTSWEVASSYHLKQAHGRIVTREKRGSFAYFLLAPRALERIRDLLERPAVANAV